MSRFPVPLPFGWFAVGRLDELPDEPVGTRRSHDKDLPPALAPSERPVTEFRRRASQFYAGPEPTPA